MIDGALISAWSNHDAYLDRPFYAPASAYLDLDPVLSGLSRYRRQNPSDVEGSGSSKRNRGGGLEVWHASCDRVARALEGHPMTGRQLNADLLGAKGRVDPSSG